LFLLDLDIVNLREFADGVLSEDAAIPCGHVATANPAVVVLDVSLIHSLRGEEAGGALPEVCEHDGLVDASTLVGVFKHLREHPVGELLGPVKLAPERCVRVVTTRMIRQPPLEMQDGWNQRTLRWPIFPERVSSKPWR